MSAPIRDQRGRRVQFRILGPLEVISGREPVPLSAAKERSLLASLVLRANQVVSRDRLYEVLWGETPPATSAMTLNTYVSHLRSALEPDRARRGEARALLTRDPGYLLAVDPDDVDALRFERLVREGLQAVAAGDAAGGAANLETALGLWRGQVLADVFYEAFAQPDVARLEELRFLAIEELMEAKLALGHHAELVGKLRQLVVEQPLRERPWGQLMLALYRCGRQGEALRAYHDLREVLADELGIDPSPALQELEDRVLLQKPELEWSPPASSALSEMTVDLVYGDIPASLPAPLTSFVGREDDVAEVMRLLEGSRLVTLIGAGGIGKTRLALEVAARRDEDHSEAVFLVELGPLSDATRLAQRVLSAIGLTERPGQQPQETLVVALATRRVLIVLDNCEHMTAACAVLAETVLRGCPEVRILATSRELLRVGAETAWRVPSLSTPEVGRADELDRFEAVRLFVDRARTVSPAFQLSAGDAVHVSELCRRLDGIPLAIELAAARTRLMSVTEMVARLDDRFRLLASGPRTAPSRHRTLRAAVDWSYESLTDRERLLLARLSVFTGGFTMGAAEEVCTGGEVGDADVLEALTALVDKSMVMVDQSGETTRYGLLETIRQYAADRLDEFGETALVLQRLLAWVTVLAVEADLALERPDKAQWLDRLETEHDNVRTALRCAATLPDPDPGLELAGRMARFWRLRSLRREGYQWLEQALARSPSPSGPARARALVGAGALAMGLGDYGPAHTRLEEGLTLWRRLDDPAGAVVALNNLSGLALRRAQFDDALRLSSEAVALARRASLDRQEATASHNRGLAIWYSGGDLDQARAALEQSADIHERVSGVLEAARTSCDLGVLLWHMGNATEARSRYEQAVAVARELSVDSLLSSALDNLGDLAYEQRDLAGARELYEEALEIARRSETPTTALVLRNLGPVLMDQGELGPARDRLEEALGIYGELGDDWNRACVLDRLADVAERQEDGSRAHEHREHAAAVRVQLENSERAYGGGLTL